MSFCENTMRPTSIWVKHVYRSHSRGWEQRKNNLKQLSSPICRICRAAPSGISLARVDECPDSEVRKRFWQAPTNFGIDEDTRKYWFLVCFLDLKFARRLIHG